MIENKKPKVSVVVPFHWMHNWNLFLERCLMSIEKQTLQDYEIILMKVGSMPVTSNRVMNAAKGEVVKVLYMDDFLLGEDYLEKLYEAFDKETEWVITAASTNPEPQWTDDIETGNNKLGSPSALAYRNHAVEERFDEKLSWLLDCDLYKRLEKEYGKPKILTEIMVEIGIHSGQMSYILSDEYKQQETNYLKEKYA